ncbi:MAG: hypothetical protein APR62_02840 [Smithella sp. SDB]|nr:MAG: hypothetical protein APR62_02840 [Smithella sp. SDB]
MLKRKLLTPSILSAIYVLLCILAFGFHIARHETDKFSAMFIGILTMPWSFVASLLISFIEIITKYEFKYIGNNIILLICVIVNTVLIFFIAKKR